MPFAAAGVAAGLLYLVWVWWVPLLPTNLYLPLLDLGKITGYVWTSALEYVCLVGGLYAAYAVGYLLVRRGRVRTTWIFTFGGLFCAELLFAYPATAADIFGYIAAGRVLATHQANPFVVAPGSFAGDAILAFLAFPNEPSQYGPLWVLLSGGVAGLAQGNLLVEVLLYKGVAAVAHLGSAGLIFRIALGLGAGVPLARASTYLFLWNPLLLWEMVGNGHNDGLMVLGGLAAAWLLVTGRPVLVLPALATGALIKVPIITIGPLLTLALWRSRRRVAIESLLLAACLVAVVYRPFWAGLETLTALRRTELFTASLGSVLRLGLAPGLGLPAATSLAQGVSLGGFGLVVLGTLWRARHASDNRQVLTLAYVTLIGAVLLATTWFQAWYVVWPFAFGAALANPRRHLEVALLSLGGFLQYLVFIYLWVMGLWPLTENIGVQSAAYAAVIGPFAVGLVYLGVSRWPLRAFGSTRQGRRDYRRA